MPRPSTIARYGTMKYRSSAANNLAFIKETAYTETTASTTAIFSPANTAGSLLVVCIGAQNGTTPTVTNCGSPGSNVDPGGNTWAKATSRANAGPIVEAEIWYTVTSAIVGSLTITMSTTCTKAVSCQEWSGANPTPLNVTLTAQGSNTTPATGTSAATATANQVVIAFISQTGAAPTYSAQSAGYTPLTTRSSAVTSHLVTLQSAYKIISVTGTQAYAATSTTSNAWLALMSTFKSS